MTRVDADRTLRLADGRTLGFAQYGDPQGFPVVLFHGTPGSRFIGRVPHVWAVEAGCRIIATDRPGHGLSTFQRDRTVCDHAGDVRALCDDLGVERFAVVGVSGGTPYVFACAEAMPERVIAGAVISGFYGLDPPVDPAELSEEVRAHFESVRADPEAARPSYDQAVEMLRGMDDPQFVSQALAKAPEEIRERAAAVPSVEQDYVDHLLEGLRDGSDGAVHDLWLIARPWDIDLSAIAIEIRLWHGGLDAVPRSHVDAVASSLKRSAVSWHPDLGHIECVFLMPEILRWLRSA